MSVKIFTDTIDTVQGAKLEIATPGSTSVNTSTTKVAEVIPTRFTLSSGGIYSGSLDGNAPQWLTDLTEAAISDYITTNWQTLLDKYEGEIENLKLGVSQNIISIQDSNQSLNALITSVKSELGGNIAGVLQQALSSVTPTEAIALVRSLVGSKWLSENGTAAESYIEQIATTKVRDGFAENAVFTGLVSAVTDGTTGLSAVATAKDLLFTKTGIDPITGELSASAGYIREIQAEIEGKVDIRLVTTENVVVGHFKEWDTISPLEIGMYKVVDGVYYTYVGGTLGEGGWMKSSGSPYTYADDVVYSLAESTGITIAELQNQIDGVIDSWYYSYTPDQTELPWNEWVAVDTANGNTNEQTAHLGDLFYDLATGTAYRFALSGAIYGWSEVTDTAITLALQSASTAQYTADGKASIYYSESVPTVKVVNGTTIPIEIGDLWVKISTGVTKVAIVANASLLSHWGDMTNTAADNALLSLADLEEARDGNVVIYYLTTTAAATGMSYGDYLIDIDSWNGTVYTTYRYENSVSGSSGTLSWYVNTGEVAKTLSASYRADVLAALAQTSADTANINNSALYYNINPSFEDWSSTYPDGYGVWNTAPTKETTITKNGNNAVRFTLNATVQGGLNFNDSVLLPGMPNDEYLSVSVTARLESGTFDDSGIRIDYIGTNSDGVTAASYYSYINLNLELPTPEIGRWYTITKVLKRPTTIAGWIFNRMDGYLFGHYTGMNGTGTSNIDIIFDNLYIRKATDEEVYTLETLQELADIASDNVLSPNEKPSVIKEYNVVIAEQNGIDAQAVSYGITTEKTAYDTAVSALTTYLATLTSPVLWNNITDNTTIVGSTFRSKFETVYTTKQALVNKIVAVAKVLADTAKGIADGKAQIIYSASAPTIITHPLLDIGDQWVDTDDGIVKVWTGTSWGETSNKAAIDARNGILHNALLASPPTATGKNDVWVVTDRYYTNDTGVIIQESSTTSTIDPITNVSVTKKLNRAIKIYDGSSWVLQEADSLKAREISWVGGASKLLYAPDGGITGWEFADGSGLQSEFKINAEKFSISDGVPGNTSYSPFIVDSTARKIYMDASVEFQGLGINGGSTTINGDKITTGSIASNIFAGNRITNLHSNGDGTYSLPAPAQETMVIDLGAGSIYIK